jgi:hypothetical protein
MTFSNLSATSNLWMHTLGLSREGPSRTGHQRNLPSKANLTGVPGISRCYISGILPIAIGDDGGTGIWEVL